MTLSIPQDDFNKTPQINVPEETLPTNLMTDEGVQRLAEKTSYALDGSLTRDELSRDFWAGHEQRVRENVAAQKSLEAMREGQRLGAQLLLQSASEGRNPTPDEVAQARALSQPPEEAPETIFERVYSQKLTSALFSTKPPTEDTIFQDSLLEDSQKTHAILDAGEFVLTKQEAVHNRISKLQKRYEDMSWLRWGAEQTLNMIPGYYWYDMRNRLEGVTAPSWLTGNNLEEQIEGLWLLPEKDFVETLDRALDEMSEDNISNAVTFAQAVLSYSTSDQLWGNLGNAIDVATLIPAGATVKVLGRMKAAVRANAQPAMRVADALAASNNLEDASKAAFVNWASKATSQVEKNITELARITPGIVDPNAYLRNAGSLAGERARRFVDTLSNSSKSLFGVFEDVNGLERVNPVATQVAMARAEAEWRNTYPRLVDHVVEFTPETDDLFGGVDQLAVYLGRKDASSFSTPEQAQRYARQWLKLPQGSYSVVENKGAYLIRTAKPIDETALDVRQARIGTDNQAPTTFLNTLLGLGAIRSPEDVLSKGHTTARKVATYGTNRVLQALREAAEPLTALGSNERSRLVAILEKNQAELRGYPQPDGSVKQLPGNWYETVGELEESYLATFRRLPSQKEVEAYFTFRTIYDWEYAFNNVSEYRARARMGGEQKSVTIRASGGENSGPIQSAWFDGRTVDNLPDKSGDDFTILSVDPKGKEPKFYLRSKMSNAQWKALTDRIAKGGVQIIQTFDPFDKAFRSIAPKGFYGEGVNYVIADTVQTKPLAAQRFGYRPGGHVINPETGFYIKQPNVTRTGFQRRIVAGDSTMMYFPTSVEAKRWLNVMEQARKLRNDPRLPKFIQDNTPFKSVGEFKALFRTEANPDAPFSWDVPFTITESGQRAVDTMDLTRLFPNEEIVDFGRSSHVPQTNTTPFAAPRGQELKTINDIGTEANPAFKFVAAPALDPMEALGRAMQSVARSRYYIDYQMRAAEDWISQFGRLLQATPAELQSDPMRWLRSPVWREGLADAAALTAAKTNRRAILQLLGQDDPVSLQWKAARQKILDGVYARLGKGSAEVVEPWLWSDQVNPITKARSWVFHAKMGLWNPTQFFKQAQGTALIAAIDGNPVRAAQANLAYWLSRGARLAEDDTKFFSRVSKSALKALGIPEDVFKEMHEALKRSGFDIVDGERADWDNYFNPKIVPSGLDKVADSSTIFFREGERLVRGAAWNTAYLRWRQANPTAKLTKQIEADILNRADLLAANMSRASSNPLYQGGAGTMSQLLSIPAQFITFHARLSEMMLGARLTWQEKARVVAVFSAMYGIPLGVAGTTIGAVAPVYDLYRQYALEHGIDTNSTFLRQVVFEGFPSAILSMVTGQDFNVAATYGPGGVTLFRDLLDGDASVILGASGKFFSNIIRQWEPFTMAVGDLFSGDPASMAVSAETFLDVAREISTINNIAGAYYSIETGRLLTKNGLAVTDADTLDSVMQGLFGLQPQEGADVWLMMRSIRQRREAQREVEKLFQKYYSRGLRAYAQGDRNEGTAAWNRARAILLGAGFKPNEMAEVYRRANSEGNNRTLLEQIGPKFAIDGPAEQVEPRMERYNDYLRRKQEQENRE